MKRAALALALLSAGAIHAQTYRWVDKDGKVHYGDRFPPAVAGDVQKRGLAAPAADAQPPYRVRAAMAHFPVTLYVSEDCAQGCQEGRAYLKRRGIPFAEKTVVTREEAEALKRLAGGAEAVVPVLAVGAKSTVGWLQGEWRRLLDAAGYPEEER
jgi:glutaredoxin